MKLNVEPSLKKWHKIFIQLRIFLNSMSNLSILIADLVEEVFMFLVCERNTQEKLKIPLSPSLASAQQNHYPKYLIVVQLPAPLD